MTTLLTILIIIQAIFVLMLVIKTFTLQIFLWGKRKEMRKFIKCKIDEGFTYDEISQYFQQQMLSRYDTVGKKILEEFVFQVLIMEEYDKKKDK
jgi:hypothetical protein